ncbi:MAG: hypothetical protein ABIA62_00195 [Candidatus Woesearchaeota archaeon]
MKPGRPAGSVIRQNIVEILYFLEKGYAYEIYKVYKEIFPKCTMRSVYHHLRRGLETQEFVIKDIKQEKGDYSWGPQAEKIYYGLGPSAAPQVIGKVKEYFDSKGKKKH